MPSKERPQREAGSGIVGKSMASCGTVAGEGKAPPEPDSDLISRVEPLPPAPLPRPHELASPDTAPRRLGVGFLLNIVERVAAIRILGVGCREGGVGWRGFERGMDEICESQT